MSSVNSKNSLKDGDFIQSLERGLSVIEAFSNDYPTLSISEAAKITNLSRPAVRQNSTDIGASRLCNFKGWTIFINGKGTFVGLCFYFLKEHMAECYPSHEGFSELYEGINVNFRIGWYRNCIRRANFDKTNYEYCVGRRLTTTCLRHFNGANSARSFAG